jgi:hypothetical protein
MPMAVAPLPSPTAGIPLGMQALESRIIQDPTNPNAYRYEVRLYNPSGSALTQYGVYEVFAGGTAATAPNPRVQAVGSSVANRQRVFCVATAATAATSWDWFVVQGNCTALVDGGTDVTAGDILKPVASQVYLVQDHATVPTVSGMAISHQTFTDTPAAAKAIYLIGNPASI